MSAAYDLARALDPHAHQGRKSWQVPCPAHEDRKPSLSVAEKNGRTLLHCFAGCSQADVIAACRDLGVWPNGRSWPGPHRRRSQDETPPPPPDAREDRAFIGAHKLFLRGVPVGEHPVARRYLERRRCVVPTENNPALGGPLLRALDDAWHWPTRTRWPAMVALVVDPLGRSMVTFHWTFLATDGSRKAPVERPRLLLAGRPSFGVVRLTGDLVGPNEPPRVLGVAEGIESALSLAHIVPDVWATLSAGTLGRLPVPSPAPEQLVIAVDADDAGRKAARACAARWHAAGVRVRLVKPELGDVNDLVAGARA